MELNKKLYEISDTLKSEGMTLFSHDKSIPKVDDNITKQNINAKKETPVKFCMNLAGVLGFYENM